MASPCVFPSSSSSSSAVISLSFGSSLPIKLDSTNFLLWRAQFLPFLRGYELVGFIDGSNPRPTSTVTPVSASVVESQRLWDRQDQLILGFLVSSLSPSVLPHVVSAETSSEAWTILNKIYASSSKSRVFELKDRLFNIQKGSSAVADYLLEVRSFSDALAAAKSPVPDTDLVLATLRGLGEEFQDFSTSVRLRADSVTFDELSGLLLTHELHMRRSATASVTPILTANLATQGPSNRRTNLASDASRSTQNSQTGSRFGPDASHRRSWNSQFGSWNRRGGRFGGRSGSRARTSGGRNSTSDLHNSEAAPSFMNETRLICQLCDAPGHKSKQCPQRFNHAFVDLANLAVQEPYTGSESVYIGSSDSQSFTGGEEL